MFRFIFIMMLLAIQTSLAAQASLTGKLTSPDGESLPGLQVRIPEVNLSSVTDAEGVFHFKDLPARDLTLELRSAFYQFTRVLTYPFPDTLFIKVKRHVRADEVIVRSTRVTSATPVSHTNLDAEELERLNVGQDVPYILQWTPSMVVTSDAGTGIGYTYLRIRGSDQTRVNVTINGIPLNDAESQQVFWVDLPDLLGSTEGVQIQRGLGSSTNGPGAFGATINLNTNRVEQEPGGSVQLGGGSFGTWRARLEAHSGLINGEYFLAGRLSRIHSDGFIDRARADLFSGFFTAGRMTSRSMFKVNLIYGQEETYQAWYGVPVQYISDPELRTFNVAGTAKEGSPHENEVDNYHQTHVQTFYTFQADENWLFSASANYTRGKGYFELYQADSVDHLNRLWLDNHFYGVAPSAQWRTESDPLSLIAGGGIFQYRGRHYGEDLTLDGELRGLLYENDAVKTDVNAYLKMNRNVTGRLALWADLQYRYVGYRFQGLNRQGSPADQEVDLGFFNPKAGVRWDASDNWHTYFFAGVGHREPNRDDYTESSELSRPKPERMINLESGWRYEKGLFRLNANGYLMWYKDQLVQTGQLNDVGAATRINVGRSYRLGLETELLWRASRKILINASATLSENRIAEAVNYFDDWDSGDQYAVVTEGAPISYSPGAIGHFALRYYVIGEAGAENDSELSLEWRTKFVGDQYLDNSGDQEAILDAYNYSDLSLEGKWQLKGGRSVGVRILVQNILDQDVVSNAWIYRFRSQGYDPVPDDPYAVSEGNGLYQLRGLFPQAGINVQAGLSFQF